MVEHVHFDLAAIERGMRNAREKMLLTMPKDPVLKLQDRFFDAMLAIQLEMFALQNEGHDPRLIGHVVGVVTGSVQANTIVASSDPDACMLTVFRGSESAHAAIAGGDRSCATMISVEVHRQTGGRA